MKLLFDHCVSEDVAKALSSHQVVRFYPKAKDEDVFRHAKKIDAVLVTIDRDFLRPAFSLKKHPGVIILSAKTESQATLLHNLLLTYRDKSAFSETRFILKKTKLSIRPRSKTERTIQLKNMKIISVRRSGRRKKR